MFKGSMVALVTPFTPQDEVDYPALLRLVDMHLSANTSGLILIGSTGESSSLAADEKHQVVKKVVSHVKGKVPIIVGTNANGTKLTIAQSLHMMSLGIDACLISGPCYLKPSQSGVIEHFNAISKAVACPIIIYNHPGRTGVDILPEMVEKISRNSIIVGIKESSGELERVTSIKSLVGDGIDIYCGDDGDTVEMVQKGAKGVISVAANLIPGKMQSLCETRNQSPELSGLFEWLGVETNPVPIKWLLAELGWMDAGVRMPLLALPDKHHQQVRAILKQLGMMNEA